MIFLGRTPRFILLWLRGLLHRSRERSGLRFLWKHTVKMVWSFFNYMIWSPFGAMICEMYPELICTDTKSLSWTESGNWKVGHILIWPHRSSKVTITTHDLQEAEDIKNDYTLTRMIPRTGAKHPGPGCLLLLLVAGIPGFTKCYNIDIVMIASKAFNRNHVMEHIDLDEKGALNDPSTRLSKQKLCL